MPRLSLLVYSERSARDELFTRTLQANGDLQLVCWESDLAKLAHSVEEHAPDLLFVQLGSSAHQVLDVVEKLPSPAPQLVACGPADASALILRTMRIGAAEYLPTPLIEGDLRRALDGVSAEFRLRHGAQPAPAIAVLGSKGGVGATSIASGLAHALASMGKRTTLVDLDLGWGDVALHFDRPNRFSLADAAVRDDLDEPYLDTLLEPVSEHLQLLCAPERPEDAERVHPRHLDRAMTLLRPRHDFVVLDVPGHLDELALRGLELADQVILVTTPEIASLAQARRRIDLLARVGIDPARVRVVLNRSSKKDAITPADLRETLGQPVSHILSNDYAVAQDCVNRGTSATEVAPASRLTAEFEELALRCHDWLSLRRPARSSRRSLLGRLQSLWRNQIHGVD